VEIKVDNIDYNEVEINDNNTVINTNEIPKSSKVNEVLEYQHKSVAEKSNLIETKSTSIEPNFPIDHDFLKNITANENHEFVDELIVKNT